MRNLARWCRVLLVKRAVAGVKNRSRHDFVHGEEVRQQLVLRAVELFQQPEAEVLVDLIGGLSVDDIYRIYMLAVRCSVESNRVVVEVLLKMLVGLKRESETARLGPSLKRIHKVI